MFSAIFKPIWSSVWGAFSPLSLFSGGIPGGWYDAEDMSTLFQDAAGTTPVTAVEQPVGRWLDKSGRGNHATQSTTLSRPVWSARYNLLQRTEQFDDAAWFKTNATVTANTATAPDGTTTADSVDFTSTAPPAPSVRIFQDTSSTTVNGQRYIGSIWMRADSNRTVELVVERSGPADQQSVQCSVTTQWQRFQITHTGVWTGSSSARLTVINPSQTGVIFMWGAQLILAADQLSTGNRYQRVGNGAVGSADYDTTGFRHYLRFDGSDDSFATGAIDFSATDKVTVWAGLTKLSDAATAMLAELSADASSNNGAFRLVVPSAGNYEYRQRGTINAQGAASSGQYPAPITNVLAGIGDISGDVVALRINGSQVASSTADQGTGNFGHYPLFIGSRNNASLRFNGRIYGLIVRGAQSSAGEIAATEAWLNQRTGAY